MGAAAGAVREPGKGRRAPSRPRVAARPRPAAPTVARPDFAELHRTLGNLGIQRLLKSGLLRGQEDAVRTGLTASELSALSSTATVPANAPGASPAATREGSPVVPPATTASEPPVPTSQPPESAAGPMPAEGGDVGAETPRRSAVATPDEDAGYQRVVRTLGTKAKGLKTPVKKPKGKVTELTAAAELPSARQKEKAAYDEQLDDMAKAPIPEIKDVTVTEFMAAFQKGFTELAKQVPKASEDNRAISNAVDFSSEKAVAVQELKAKRDVKSEPLRTAASQDPLTIAAKAESPAEPPPLVRDPAGPVPTIPNARAAAPKPVPSESISLDAQSQALDDALTNQVAGGQVVNISEASLAFPESGEKSFDEAGEAKRKAQEAIRRLIPSYRATEAGILKKAGNAAAHTVSSGVQDYHGSREQSFEEVFNAQTGHERTVETQKDAVLGQFARTFAEKKKLVEDELASLNGVGEEFEALLTDAEKELKRWVRNNLEYIYTPGVFDYSDWIDKREGDVQKEYERLSKGQPQEFTIGGQHHLTLWMKALKTIQDRDARELFKEAKQYFLDNITAGARTIAKKVVDTLNRANGHIKDGLSEAKVIYGGLSAKEKSEYQSAFDAVVGQYTTLAESVADRHREIVSDMARSYHKVAATLDATFEAIRKDVLTSWWEKAWNKIKAVVNAIIEFATRIAELLVGMLHLLGDIISSPRYFFNNLVTGIGRGLSTFVGRIDEFLADAFFDWLRGSAGPSIQLPTVWDAKGIFGLFTQLLGLTVETIWQRMEVVYDKTIANAFRRGEVVLDKGLELFAIVRNEGLGGLWDHVQESLGTILTDTLTSMKETVLYAAIKKVIIEVGKLLVPGGGFIAIAEKIIRLLQFIVEARNKILDLIQSFMQSMELAVRGDVSGIVTKVTGALKQFITVALDFLVTFFGLGGLKSKIERVIDRTRSPIIRAIDWLLGKLKPLVMKGVGTIKGIVQAGLPQNPNERLKLGIRTAVSTANRFAGKRVGAIVLNPLLAGIRVRYGFTTLHVVAQGNVWAVHGQLNPETLEFTRVIVGTDADTGAEATRTIVDPPKVLVFEFRRFTANQNVSINEMREGLQHHQDALNALTVGQWLANIHFRAFLKGAVAAEERDLARKALIQALREEIVAEYRARGVALTRSQQDTLIKFRVRTKHASHDADAIAGGNIDDFDSLERGAVNSYIGSNWGRFRPELEAYARELREQFDPADREKVHMNFRLRIKFSN